MSFFNKEEEVVESQVLPEKIKVGEEEFTQEELGRLVGIGKIGMEADEKFNTKIDRVYPEYTKSTQRVKELESEMEALRATISKPTEPTNNVWDDNAKAEAKKAMQELYGDEIMTKKDVENFYANQREATKLLDDVNHVISEAQEAGKPVVSVEDILNHMNETGIKSPLKAYKDLKEEELDKWKEEKIKELKPSGMTTTESSTAGAKEPPEVRTTTGNLRDLLKEHFKNVN